MYRTAIGNSLNWSAFQKNERGLFFPDFPDYSSFRLVFIFKRCLEPTMKAGTIFPKRGCFSYSFLLFSFAYKYRFFQIFIFVIYHYPKDPCLFAILNVSLLFFQLKSQQNVKTIFTIIITFFLSTKTSFLLDTEYSIISINFKNSNYYFKL